MKHQVAADFGTANAMMVSDHSNGPYWSHRQKKNII